MFSPQPPTSPQSNSASASTSRRPLSALYGSQGPVTARDTFGSVGNKEDLEQTDRNNRLVAIVHDDAEVLESLYENLKFAIVNKRDQAMQKNEKNEQNIDALIRQWKWTKPLNWDFEKLISEYGFNLSPNEILLHHDFIDFSFDEPEQQLNLLVNAKNNMSKARLAAVRDELRALDKQFLGETGAPMSKFCAALFELAHTDVLSHARTELSRSDSKIAQLENQIESNRQLRDTAVARGDIPAIEPPHRNMIKSYVDLLEVIQKRIIDLTSTDEETNIFRKNCNEVIKGARELVHRLGDENRNLQTRCLADIRRSETIRVNEGMKDADAVSSHKEYVLEVREKLDENQKRQKVVLDKIAELTKELFTLTDSRREMIKELCVEKEQEEHRSANYEEFGIVRSEHLPYVDRIRDLTERRLGAEQGLTDYINEMQRRYNEMDIEGMLDELVEPELRKYIATYRSLVFTVGDLMTKKSLRVESLLRQRRQLKLQQELAVSSLDHEVGTYVKKHDELTRQLNEAQTDLTFLQHTQNVAEKNYSQIGALQQRFGLQCLHPVVEYAAQSAEERQKFADAATRYVEDESVELDKSKAHVRQLIQMNQVERSASPQLGSAAVFGMSGGSSVNRGSPGSSFRPMMASSSSSNSSPNSKRVINNAPAQQHQQQKQQHRFEDDEM